MDIFEIYLNRLSAAEELYKESKKFADERYNKYLELSKKSATEFTI